MNKQEGSKYHRRFLQNDSCDPEERLLGNAQHLRCIRVSGEGFEQLPTLDTGLRRRFGGKDGRRFGATVGRFSAFVDTGGEYGAAALEASTSPSRFFCETST